MLLQNNSRAARAQRNAVVFRWGITLTVILLISVYQLGIKSSPAGFAESKNFSAEISPEPETAQEGLPDSSNDTVQAGTFPAAADSGQNEPEAVSTGPWLDGEYTGEAEGYGGPVKLTLTVANGWISEIVITEADGEDKPYLKDAKKIIPKVIEAQNTDLDAISGATTTCWAILNAVDLALAEAER